MEGNTRQNSMMQERSCKPTKLPETNPANQRTHRRNNKTNSNRSSQYIYSGTELRSNIESIERKIQREQTNRQNQACADNRKLRLLEKQILENEEKYDNDNKKTQRERKNKDNNKERR